MQASAYEVYERIRTFLHTQNRCAKKSTLCQKLQSVWQIARPKQRFLSFTFYKTKILRENLVYLLFHWFSGENCVIFTFS